MTVQNLRELSAASAKATGRGPESVGTLLIVVGMFFSPLSALQPVTPPPVVTYADVFFVAGFALMAPRLVRSRLEPPLPYILGALLLLATALLSVAVTAEPGVSIPAVLRLTYASMFLPLAFLLWRPSQSRIALLAASYVLGACCSLCFGLIEGADLEGRYLGLAPHPNSFGHSMAFAAALVPYLASTITTRRGWWYLAGGACCYGIWISGSRASLLAFALVALAYPLIERSVRATATLLYATVVVAIAWAQLVASGGNNALARLIGGGSAEDSDGQRLARLLVAVDEFARHPFLGTGFEQGREAHNIYLQVVVAVGIFGLIGFLLMLSALVVPLFTASRPSNRLAYPALLFVLIGPLTDVLWDTLPWAVLSLAMLARHSERTTEPIPPGQEVVQTQRGWTRERH